MSRLSTAIEPGDMLVMYSDGITEAENPEAQPFEESGLERVLARHAGRSPSEIAAAVLQAVEHHARAPRFADDLTLLVLQRQPAPRV